MKKKEIRELFDKQPGKTIRVRKSEKKTVERKIGRVFVGIVEDGQYRVTTCDRRDAYKLFKKCEFLKFTGAGWPVFAKG